MRRKFNGKIFGASILIFAVVFVGVFFGVQWFTKTGVFRIPGVVYYDESLSEDELVALEDVFNEEVDLDKDVYISARYEIGAPVLSEGEFVSEILVPVTDFYVAENGIHVSDVDEFLQGENAENIKFSKLVDKNLKHTDKLLELNDCYYLDEFTCGGVWRVVKFESEKYAEEIEPLVAGLFEGSGMSSENVLTMAQTGVTAFSRLMNGKMNSVGNGGYFAEKIGGYLSGFDITHTSNEASFVSRPSTSGGTGVPICADTRFQETLLAIGLDVVELTGNHNQDCGDTAALETIDWYEKMGISIVGGGRTATEASRPLEISEKGSSITMLAFNQSTGGATYGNTPGANQYYEEVAAAQIAEAKARGDIVIVDVQYYECNMYASTYEDPICDYANSAAGDQVGLFRHLIDLGADIVVGTAAHQAQTFELHGDGVIYYGLGNLFFDQYRWPGTTRSMILVHYFYEDQHLQTRIVPTVYDENFQTELMDEETAEWWISRLISERP